MKKIFLRRGKKLIKNVLLTWLVFLILALLLSLTKKNPIYLSIDSLIIGVVFFCLSLFLATKSYEEDFPKALFLTRESLLGKRDVLLLEILEEGLYVFLSLFGLFQIFKRIDGILIFHIYPRTGWISLLFTGYRLLFFLGLILGLGLKKRGTFKKGGDFLPEFLSFLLSLGLFLLLGKIYKGLTIMVDFATKSLVRLKNFHGISLIPLYFGSDYSPLGLNILVPFFLAFFICLLFAINLNILEREKTNL